MNTRATDATVHMAYMTDRAMNHVLTERTMMTESALIAWMDACNAQASLRAGNACLRSSYAGTNV